LIIIRKLFSDLETMVFRSTSLIKVVNLFMLIIFVSACSPKKYILNQFDGVFESVESVYMSDDDPELIKEAFPFNLKIIEILLDQSPNDRDLLLTAMSSFTIYAFGFLMEDAERLSIDDYQAGSVIYKRANKMFERALEYGMRGMELKNPKFAEWWESPDNQEIICYSDDIPYLYWLSATLGGLISSSQGDPIYVVDLPKIGLLLEKSMEIDETWNNGALYNAMIAYTMKRPDIIENRTETARNYFEKAVDASSGNDCSVYVRFAEAVCVTNQNKTEFVEKLNYVLDFDLDQAKEYRLANALAQSRATWLLSRVDALFY